ncbi:hypothetical protein AO736_11630 [Aeromonas veronii]|nr:hypothetical protein AO732_02625 [Aeromonas veronii]KRW43829.1 hypothetical protein AO736_11630 [Aeromonas veronii]
MALVGDTIALVVSLPAYPQKQASPDNGQPLDLPLREDLPGRFFTMEMFVIRFEAVCPLPFVGNCPKVNTISILWLRIGAG